MHTDVLEKLYNFIRKVEIDQRAVKDVKVSFFKRKNTRYIHADYDSAASDSEEDLQIDMKKISKTNAGSIGSIVL